MIKSKIYYGFDLLKFLMALLIVAGHFNLFIEYLNVYHITSIIYSLAVPVFFAISTYLYAKKLIAAQSKFDAWQVCKKDVIRLLALSIFGIIVNFPMAYDTFFSIANWKEIVVGLAILDPIRGLWFIKALIINKIVIFVFRNHVRTLSICSLVVFVLFSLGYTSLLNGFSELFHPYFNFYFHTFFCCIGLLFAKYPCVATFRLDILSMFLIAIFIWHICNYEYAVIAWCIICPFFFINLFARVKEPTDAMKPLFLLMRKSSILFYFLHFNFLWLYDNILNIKFLNTEIKYVVVLLSCLLLSMLILKIENRNKFLKYSH